jgi:hypothetical protein
VYDAFFKNYYDIDIFFVKMYEKDFGEANKKLKYDFFRNYKEFLNDS